MQELNSESFKSLVELAEVQKQIAVARAEFETLRSTMDTFKAQREAEALAIVDNVLTASREALAEADKNRDAIMALLTVAKDCVDDAHHMSNEVASMVEKYEAATNKTIIVVRERTGEILAATDELKKRRSKLNDDERALEIARAGIARDRILLADRTHMLAQELKRIQNIK